MQDHSDTCNVNTAAPDQTPPSAEAPPMAAETTSPVSTEAEADGGADTRRDSVATREQAHARPKSKQRRTSKRTDRSGAAPASAPRGLAERLLARVELPRVTLERRLLPPKLLAALDAAGLGAPALLPSSVFMLLAAIGAIAGPTIQCEPVDRVRGMAGCGLALRVTLLAPERRSTLVPAAILAGVLAVENDLLDVYQQTARQAAEQRQAAAGRRRLYEQASKSAVALGIALPPPLPDEAPAQPGPRPRIVVFEGAGAAIRAAAAGSTGLLIVDERRMTSMAGVGEFFDEPTDALLNAAAAGHPVPIADPATGRTTMRSLPASVIGTLKTADCGSLHCFVSHYSGCRKLALRYPASDPLSPVPNVRVGPVPSSR